MNTEVQALLNLLDDPDTTVYEVVQSKLISYGSSLIPLLEQHCELQHNDLLHQRAHYLIQELHRNNIINDFKIWKNQEEPNLLEAAILLSKITFPEIDKNDIYKTIEKISKDAWIELNNYLTPLEKINVISNIVYKFHKFNGVEINKNNRNDFLIHNLIQTKKGNSFSLAILYITLCEILDVPVSIFQFPKQLILGYLNLNQDFYADSDNNFDKIKFFIDPVFGNAISHNDIELFFKKINIAPSNNYFTPLNAIESILFVIKEYQKCFINNNENKLSQFFLQLIEILQNND